MLKPLMKTAGSEQVTLGCSRTVYFILLIAERSLSSIMDYRLLPLSWRHCYFLTQISWMQPSLGLTGRTQRHLVRTSWLIGPRYRPRPLYSLSKIMSLRTSNYGAELYFWRQFPSLHLEKYYGKI